MFVATINTNKNQVINLPRNKLCKGFLKYQIL